MSILTHFYRTPILLHPLCTSSDISRAVTADSCPKSIEHGLNNIVKHHDGQVVLFNPYIHLLLTHPIQVSYYISNMTKHRVDLIPNYPQDIQMFRGI